MPEKEVYEFHPKLFAIITASFPWLPHRLPGYVRRSSGSRLSCAYRGYFSAIIALLLLIVFVAKPFYDKYYVQANAVLYFLFMLIVYVVIYYTVAVIIFYPVKHNVLYRIDKTGVYYYRKKNQEFGDLQMIKKGMHYDYMDEIKYNSVADVKIKLSLFGELFNYSTLRVEPKLPAEVVTIHNYAIQDFYIYGIPKDMLLNLRIFIKDRL